jgi:hypothetical protein
MRTCLLLPFYGPLPPWFPLFLRSVERNPSVDLFLITNEELRTRVPSNVHVVRMSMSDIEDRVRRTLSPEFRLPFAYKLCDLKPYYGIVFDRLIEDYAFWGYCDIDLVFGRLTPLLSADRLAGTDVFSADAGPFVGTLALYRNHPEVNAIGTRIPDFVRQLNTAEYLSLDEKQMTALLEATPSLRWDRPRRLAESQLSLSDLGRMVGRTTGVEGDPDEFFSSRGRTFVRASGHEAQEVLYLHFIGLKRSYHWSRYDPTVDYEEFAFSAAGFRPWRVPPSFWHRWERTASGGALRLVSRVRSAMAASLSTGRRQAVKRVIADVERRRRA